MSASSSSSSLPFKKNPIKENTIVADVANSNSKQYNHSPSLPIAVSSNSNNNFYNIYTGSYNESDLISSSASNLLYSNFSPPPFNYQQFNNQNNNNNGHQINQNHHQINGINGSHLIGSILSNASGVMNGGGSVVVHDGFNSRGGVHAAAAAAANGGGGNNMNGGGSGVNGNGNGNNGGGHYQIILNKNGFNNIINSHLDEQQNRKQKNDDDLTNSVSSFLPIEEVKN